MVNGGAGDDVIRGGAGDDVLNGGNGIDNLYGDDGDDRMFGEGGRTSNGRQAGQRLFGVRVANTMFAFAPDESSAQNVLAGDQLFGGDDGDYIYGNIRREVLSGDAGNEFIAGDARRGSQYLVNTDSLNGAADILVGGSVKTNCMAVLVPTLSGARWHGLDRWSSRSDTQYGGSGIDLFTLNGTETVLDVIDGHYGKTRFNDVADDNATDILTILGTSVSDTILIGQSGGNAAVLRNGTIIPVNMLNATGGLLVEQFRIAGLAGNDRLGFYSPQAIQAGVLGGVTIPVGFTALDTSSLSARSRDNVAVLDGNDGDDLLLGSAGRDQMDGGRGSDSLYGFAGDDRLWGDMANGAPSDIDNLYAGQGNDDLVGGVGKNNLYAWSYDPNLGGQFGVYVDTAGNLFSNDGDLNNDGSLDADDQLTSGTKRAPYVLEATGLNRMLGSERDDNLYGGTVVDFMYGNGGRDALYRSNGTTMESMDGSLAGEEWKQYARESDQVWYVGGSNADDEIKVDFVTEPGLLTDRHLVTRLITNNNGNFSFAAQVRLDFEATDEAGNRIWSKEGLAFRTDQLFAVTGEDARTSENSPIIAAADARLKRETALLSSLIPPEDDFLVILVDALGGNDYDHITVGPHGQKTVWIDCGRR